jgi:ubiquinone/menaquinone biosynthesis C-methylase UbiE
MTTFLYFCFGLVGLFLIVFLAWRLASRRYSLPCPTWLSWLLDNPFAKGMSGRTTTTVLRLDLKPGMKVLDVGCGPGRLTIPIAEKVGPQGQVVAVDIQPGMLRRAQERAKTANLNNIRFLQTGAGEGKLERSQYDRALLVTVLGEIPNREAALREIWDALKPGGFLSVTEVIQDPHFRRRSTVRKLAGAVGFKEKECFGNSLSFTMNLKKPYGA